MYTALGTIKQNESIEADLDRMMVEARARASRAVSSVSYVHRPAAQRWSDNILGLLSTTKTTLTNTKNGQPFFERHPADAKRMLIRMRLNISQEFSDLDEASSGPFTRALTAQNLEQTILEVANTVASKVGKLAVAAGTGLTDEVAKGSKTNPLFGLAVALGIGLTSAYIVRSFR